MKIEICLPTYNEERILKANVFKILAYLEAEPFFKDGAPAGNWRVVLLINGSYDRSLLIAQELQTKFPSLVEIENSDLAGKGRAIKDYCQKSPADLVAYMDCDLAVDLTDLPELLRPLIEDKADLVLGSRLLSASKTDRSWYRDLISWVYNFLSRKILNHNFSDCQCGFKAFRLKDFRNLADQIQNGNWFFDTELLVFFQRAGLRIKEIPIDWKEARYQARKSKVRVFRDGFSFLNNLIKLRRRLDSKRSI